ncbi:MAG: apolipoprotein N-acyltransferase [Gammaproteobacteria bacterium]|nr:apolipoprotein N-acyltransferase [Gammaproteobacteria bacterium]
MLSLSESTFPLEDTAPTRPLYLAKRLTTVFAGLLLPLGFAPFHLPGLALLSIVLLYIQLSSLSKTQALQHGLLFGIGSFGFGVSWIYVSIHDYGHLHPLLAGFITFLFVFYLSLYTALFSWLYRCCLPKSSSILFNTFLFSTLWVLIEYARSYCFTGFPWLLLGVGQFDAPIQALLPICGVYGTGWVACLAATWLAQVLLPIQPRRMAWLIASFTLLLGPMLLQHYPWTQEKNDPINVGVVQTNLSMRDKWDQALFWSILDQYQSKTQALLGVDLIVLPESAIPLPENYVHDYLNNLSVQAKRKKTALLIGIPKEKPPTSHPSYYNTLLALGQAKGQYLKRHLVPFGEYIPHPFQTISAALQLADPALTQGPLHQALIQVKHHAIASLICYELAYEELLRNQLPEAEWIVSVSDDGWFGRSLAMYQQQQIAQVRSLQTGRYQIVSNNDGLSSLLNTQGQIIASLAPFSSGTLTGIIKPATGLTPWSHIGDRPIIALFALFFLLAPLARYLKKTLSLSTRLNSKR